MSDPSLEVTGSRRALVDPQGAPVVAKGSLWTFRLVDVADAIDLQVASKRLSVDAHKRTTFQRPPPRRDKVALRRAMPTLGIDLGPQALSLQRIDVELAGKGVAHAYERGTIAVSYRAPIAAGTSMSELPRLVRQLFDETSIAQSAQREIGAILERIGPAVHGPRVGAPVDAYTVVFIEAFAGGGTVAELAAWTGLPKLMLGETAPAPLHPRQIAEALEGIDGYQAGDLFVMSDRCAVVVEPSGDTDVVQVLEYVRAQVLELTYLDELLDDDLAAAHRALSAPRSKALTFFWDPHGRETRRIARRLAETTRFTQRIEASTRLLGDSYLARVARAAFARFGAADLTAAIERKHQLVAGVHEMLHGEAESIRGLVLEITIVGLIVFEVVHALVAT